MDTPKDTPVRAGEGLAAHTVCSTRAQGSCGKAGFATWGGGHGPGDPTRTLETWPHPGPLGQTASKIPVGPEVLAV